MSPSNTLFPDKTQIGAYEISILDLMLLDLRCEGAKRVHIHNLNTHSEYTFINCIKVLFNSQLIAEFDNIK